MPSSAVRCLRLRASRSFSLSRKRPNVATQNTFAPCAASFDETYVLAPWMSEMSAITAVTPTIVPSRVRNERSLLARRAPMAIRVLSRNSTAQAPAPSGADDPPGVLAHVALDVAVAQAHDAVGMGGDVLLARDHEHGVARPVGGLQRGQDLVAGLAVEVAGRLVGQ